MRQAFTLNLASIVYSPEHRYARSPSLLQAKKKVKKALEKFTSLNLITLAIRTAHSRSSPPNGAASCVFLFYQYQALTGLNDLNLKALARPARQAGPERKRPFYVCCNVSLNL